MGRWVTRKLCECFKLKSGDGLTKKAMVEGPFPVYGGNGIAGTHNKSNLSGEHVIIGRVGALCGNARHITEDIWLTDNAFQVVGFESDFDAVFLTYLLNAKNLRRLARHAAQPVISNSSLKDLVLEFPESKIEQKWIVTILDEAFEAIAIATANTEKNLANARELFESKLTEVFDRRTSSWPQRHLGVVCENLDSQRVPITKSKRNPGSIPYYGASGVVDHVADYLFDEDLLLVSEDGANLLARTYPIAFSISGKSWVNNHAHVLRFSTMAHQKFVEYYLNSTSLMPYVSGMAQPKLNQKALNSIPLPWSDVVSDVEIIVNSIETTERSSRALSDIYEQKLALLTELKQSILHKAFTGELTADTNAADRTLSEAGL